MSVSCTTEGGHPVVHPRQSAAPQAASRPSASARPARLRTAGTADEAKSVPGGRGRLSP
jgi:hypothetical protein